MKISNLIAFLFVLGSMVAKAIEIESHGHFLLNNYDTSDAKEIWPDDRWWMSCFFVDLNQDGFEEVITTTISQADRYGCAWYFWTTKPDGKLHPVREDCLREERFVFTCYYYSYYRLIYRDGRDQLIGLDLDARFLNAGNNKVQSSTSDWIFGISTNNQLSVAKVSPSLDDVFFSSSSVGLRRMYPESYKGFSFDFVPQKAWFGGYEFPKPIGSVKAPEKFHAFLSSFQKETQIRSGVTNDVSVFAVLLDANNDGLTDCYLSSSVDGISKDVYRWALYVNEKGVLEKAGEKVKSVPHRDDLPSLEPNVEARKDAFCRVVRFDAPPTYIVLDESKVARGLVKKTITDRLTHSIEKLPAEEVPVFAEPPAKTTILSHVKANASQTLPEVDALRGL